MRCFKLFLGVCVLLFTSSVQLVLAQTVNPKNDATVTETDIINKLLGSGVVLDGTVTPVFTFENNAQMGIFSGYSELFGSNIDEGVVISTGNVADVVTAINTVDNTSTA